MFAKFQQIHLGHVVFAIAAVGIMIFGLWLATMPVNPNAFLPAELESKRHEMVTSFGVVATLVGFSMMLYMAWTSSKTNGSSLFFTFAMMIAAIGFLSRLLVFAIALVEYVTYA